MQKTSLIHQLIIEIQSILRVPLQEWSHLFLPMPTQNIFNLFQHAKNQAISSICSGDMTWLIQNRCNWIEWVFWPMFQKTNISEIWVLCRNTATRKNLHKWTNSEDANDQKFQFCNFRKSYLWPILMIIGTKNLLLLKIQLLQETLHGFLTPCQN